MAKIPTQTQTPTNTAFKKFMYTFGTAYSVYRTDLMTPAFIAHCSALSAVDNVTTKP